MAEYQTSTVVGQPLFTRPQREAYCAFLRGDQPTYATVLLAGLLKAYGVEVLDWDTQTIEMEVARDFGVHMPRVVFDQLAALVTAITTDTVYHSVEMFDQTVNALNRASVQHGQEAPTAEEVAWAVTELAMADPEPVGLAPQPYSRQIAAYVEVVLRDDGMLRAPTALKFAEPDFDSSWSDDPDMQNGMIEAHQSTADGVDQEMDTRAGDLLDQLEAIGVQLRAS